MIAPNRPRKVLSVWLGPWSWYGQAPTDSGVHSHWYVNDSPGRDEAAGARVLAHVGAVVLRVVLDAVRVHRDRLVELAVGVAEVHDEHVADLGGQRGAGDVRVLRRIVGEPGRHQAVDERRVGVLAREAAVVPVVVAGRRDRPARGLGLDPVLAPLPAGSRLDLRHVLGGRGTRPAHRRGRRVGLAEPARRRDVDLLAPDRAQQRRAACDAEERAPGGGGRFHDGGRS